MIILKLNKRLEGILNTFETMYKKCPPNSPWHLMTFKVSVDTYDNDLCDMGIKEPYKFRGILIVKNKKLKRGTINLGAK